MDGFPLSPAGRVVFYNLSSFRYGFGGGTHSTVAKDCGSGIAAH